MLFLVPDFLVRLLDLMVLVLELDATHGTVDCNSTLHFFFMPGKRGSIGTILEADPFLFLL
jgi:hypothetical protein